MNIEELKLILETVSQLGSEGKVAFISWAVLAYLPGVLGWMFTISVIGWVALRVVREALRADRSALSRLQIARDAVREVYLYEPFRDNGGKVLAVYHTLNEICKEQYNENQ